MVHVDLHAKLLILGSLLQKLVYFSVMMQQLAFHQTSMMLQE